MENKRLIQILQEKIEDEKNMKNEYYEGRRSAFEFVLTLLQDSEDDNI